MRRLFVFFWLGICGGLAEWGKDSGEFEGLDGFGGWKMEDGSKYTNFDDKDDEKDDRNDFKDNEDDIIRPCKLSDWECIRKFLASKSDCVPSKGPAPDPLHIPYDKFYFPLVNLTITHTNLQVEGFKSANITEFYVNKKTKNLVIAINVENVKQTSPKSYFTFQRTAKEPIITSDFTTVTYKSITYTAVIPNFPNLKLELAEIHADVHDRTPFFIIGPEVAESKDPDVIKAYAEFILNIPTIIQEAYVFQSYLVTGVFIEKKLCDFGVDVYDNYLKFINTKGYTLKSKNNIGY